MFKFNLFIYFIYAEIYVFISPWVKNIKFNIDLKNETYPLFFGKKFEFFNWI